MLTQGLIAKICSGATDVTGNLQVSETRPLGRRLVLFPSCHKSHGKPDTTCCARTKSPLSPQVLYTKPVPSHADRFRLSLSDGENHIIGMLATQHSKVRSPARPSAQTRSTHARTRTRNCYHTNTCVPHGRTRMMATTLI